MRSSDFCSWATEIDLTNWTLRPLDITTNSFCAGGGVTGNGSLVNVGGNNAVSVSGDTANTVVNGVNVGALYGDSDGGKILRTIDPCTNDQCNWVEWSDLQVNRWYPSVETLPNGTVAIVGGELCASESDMSSAHRSDGGYTALANQNQANPTVQVWPGTGNNVQFGLLARNGPLSACIGAHVQADSQTSTRCSTSCPTASSSRSSARPSRRGTRST